MNLFKIFRKKTSTILTFENLVEMNLITKAEMLLIKKERAIKEWENETKEPVKKGRRVLRRTIGGV